MAKGSFQNAKRITSTPERAALKPRWSCLLSHTLLPSSPHSRLVGFCQVPGYHAPSHLFSPPPGPSPSLVNPSSSFSLGVTAQAGWRSSVTAPQKTMFIFP